MCSFSSLYVLALSLVTVHIAHAQDSPVDYVNAHNAARSEVGVPNIVWNEIVAAFAQNSANQRKRDCNINRSGVGGANPPRRYGENLAKRFIGNFNSTDAVKLWVSEKANYDYNSNKCVGGNSCGHYKQIVWRNSVRLGCARVICDYGGTLVICNNDPPGNYIGEKPY